MAIFGYARVSTKEQNITSQIEVLKDHGVDEVYQEKVSGNSVDNRPELKMLLDRVLRKGDVLKVTKLDRLARSNLDLLVISKDLEDRGISLVIIDSAIDTSTATGKAFLGMLSIFSEFETSLRRERQAIGIAKAKKEGKYKGRQTKKATKATYDKIQMMIDDGINKAQIARDLNLSRSSLYRIIKTYDKK